MGTLVKWVYTAAYITAIIAHLALLSQDHLAI